MALDKVEAIFASRLAEKDLQGIKKRHESVITGIKAPENGLGPRYFLSGMGDQPFLRMNSNNYLGLSTHPAVIDAEAQAAKLYGAGPGAVRFISGTYEPHKDLENKLAEFHGRESAMLFSAAYATMLGVLPQFIDHETLVVSDMLNHNCIINAIRLAKPAQKEVYSHLDIGHLKQILQANKGLYKRVCVVTDGVFSMRGDYAALDQMTAVCRQYENDYEQGIITLVDDSHGVGALGKTGRGTEEVTGAQADVLVSTLGKALGVNGGYVVSSAKVIDYLRETAPLYIYSNPITPAEASAALQALIILDAQEGEEMLEKCRHLSGMLRAGLIKAGFQTLQGEHPIVPLLTRDTELTSALEKHLFNHGILTTGLNYPVVPKGDEEIRLQVSAAHSAKDIDYLLAVLTGF